jgi:CheY-like chemotaxis protein
VAKGLLLPYGLRIETATSGLEAIEKIKGGGVYDIVFMDHMMPDMDGMEATKIMRGMGYTRPIVALTANAVAGQAEIFLANGFEGFISKPIDSRELNAVLNNLIRDKQPAEVIEAARRKKEGKKIAAPAPKAPELSRMAEFFLRDAEQTVEVLENICARWDFVDDADLKSYVINVHGIKSSLANIGETELSGGALKLEKAGRDQDIAVMSAETPAFLSALKAVIAKIKPRPEYAAEISDEDAAYLRKKLIAVQAACAAYDKKTAKAVLNELRQKPWPSRTVSLLEAISAHVFHSAFQKASDAAKEAL